MLRKTTRWWLPWLIVAALWVLSVIGFSVICIPMGGGPCELPDWPQRLLTIAVIFGWFSLLWLPLLGPFVSFLLFAYQAHKLIQILRNVG